MLADVLATRCRGSWRDWFGEPTPDHLDLAFVASRARSDERAVALVFESRRLRAVLKLALGDQPGLKREHDVLRHLARRSDLESLVPSVLGTGYERVGWRTAARVGVEPVWMLPLSPVAGHMWRPPDPGQPISTRAFSDVERVLRELDGLTTRIGQGGPLSGVVRVGVDWLEGLDRLPIADPDRSQLEAHYLSEDAARESSLWAHGDLAPGNVRLSRSGVRSILDWEMCDTAYEPWFDRLYPALLALSSVLLRRVTVPSASWPVRWLNVLASEAGSVPIKVRCLRATAELASRSVRLERGSIDRWIRVARYLQGAATANPE